MSARSCLGVTTFSLLATVIAASAAQSTSAMKSASDALGLTAKQQREIYRDGSKQKLSQASPTGFAAKVGEAAPNSVTLHPLPASVTSKVSSVKSDDYAMLRRQVLIIDPSTRKIIDVITH
jgi:hypothetical protein